MTFYDFLSKFAKDDTPIGDLARDASIDPHFPKGSDSDAQKAYLRAVAYGDDVIRDLAERSIAAFDLLHKY